MSHQEIHDMLTQRQSSYAWEAYLKHRKQGKIEQPSAGKKAKPTQAPRHSGKAGRVGHNKCCNKKGKQL